MPALKETRAGQPVARHSFRRVSLSHVLVVGQIAISLLMLVAAGLFVRTLSNLQSIELGFNRENVLLFQVDARKAGHKDPGDCRVLRRSAQTIQRDPGRAQRESLRRFACRRRALGCPSALPARHPMTPTVF